MQTQTSGPLLERLAAGWRAMGDGPGVDGLTWADYWQLPDAPIVRSDATGYGWAGRAARTWMGTVALSYTRLGVRPSAGPTKTCPALSRLAAMHGAARRRAALLEGLAEEMRAAGRLGPALRSILSDLDVEQRHAELVRLEIQATRAAERRASLDASKLADLRRRDRERQARRRAAETPEQTAKRRARVRERARVRRAAERRERAALVAA